MATAEELLTASANIGDEYLLVDNEFRTIIIPDNLKYLGVANDKDVLKLRFKMPRYFSDTDLSTFSIRVNYSNAKDEKDSYTVKDAVIGSESIIFSWLVGRVATRIKGKTEFSICAVTLDDEGNVDKDFNTSPVTLEVLEGLEANARTVTLYSDIIEQWRQELFGIGDTEEANIVAASEAQQTAIVNKGVEVLATIPADYTTTYQMANEAIRSKADAIVCSAQGETVVISDSSDDYICGLKVFGKTSQVATTGAQLLDIPDMEMHTDRGLIQYVSNGVCVVKGTATSTAAFNLTLAGNYSSTNIIFTLPAGTYTVADCRIYSYDGTTRTVYADTFTLTEPLNVTWVSTRSYGATESVDEVLYPMLNAGSDSLPWERYSNGAISPSPNYPQDLSHIINPILSIRSRNLIPSISKDVTNCGVEYSLNSDGSITLNGTATAYSTCIGPEIEAKSLRGKTLTLRGTGVESNTIVTQIKFIWDGGYIYRSVNGKPFGTMIVPEQAETMRFEAYVTANQSVSNFTIYPQLTLGNELVEYTPYQTTQSVGFDYTIPGAPVNTNGNYIDSTGQQWICDEIDLERGVYVQRVYQGSAPTTGWEDEKTTDTYYECKTYAATNKFVNGKVLATHFKGVDNNRLVVGSNRNFYARFPLDCGITNLDDASLLFASGEVQVVAQLLTPVEIALTAEEIEAFKALKTYCPCTIVTNNGGAELLVRYNADTKTWINNLIDSKIATALANI